MKKLIIYFIVTLLFTLPSAINSYIIVSGSTFTMPSGNTSNQEGYNKEYHKYSIENKNTEAINKYNMYNNNLTDKKDNTTYNNKNYSGNNHSNRNNMKQNIQNNNTPIPYTIPDNNITNNKNNHDKIKENFNKNKINKKTINNEVKNKTTNNKINNKKRDKNKPMSNTIPGNYNINNITIEFSKHFIKISSGSTINITLKTKPKNLSFKNIIYKSDDNSIAMYKNSKITGIKKGFTTIFISLPDGTIKAACPVKVV